MDPAVPLLRQADAFLTQARAQYASSQCCESVATARLARERLIEAYCKSQPSPHIEARAGYLDFLCPMDYTTNDLSFTNLVENQLRLVETRVPVYPGIGAWRLEPDRVVGQIHHARRLGAAGFTIFNFQPDAARALLPAIALGAGSEPAKPPHQK